jgi:hypothetical protein
MNVAPSTAFGIHRMIPGTEFVIFEKSSHMPCPSSRHTYRTIPPRRPFNRAYQRQAG